MNNAMNNAMNDITNDPFEKRIAEAKSALRSRMPDFAERFAAETARLTREVAAVEDEMASGHAIVEVDYAALAEDDVSDAVKARIRRRGVVVARNVFPQDLVAEWNDELTRYVRDNHYFEKQKEKAGLDNYFGELASSKPQIFGLYWSQPQMQARQSEQLAVTRRWLNGLWRHPDPARPEFDGGRECLYADRIRQREPGDASLGLSPHIDGGSVERWIEPSFHKVYAQVLFGDADQYDPFNAAGRAATKEIPSPAVCRMFRTYQGWTALTRQGPGDGTLNVVPIARVMAWLLLRALADDVAPNDLCGAKPRRALGVMADFHELPLRAYVPIPTVHPGDTVWWHPDVVHGVEDQHRGHGYSNVIYIGAAPDCAKNRRFLELLRPAFEAGRSSPDFAAEDYEVDFTGRFTPDDLSPLGRLQLGYGRQ